MKKGLIIGGIIAGGLAAVTGIVLVVRSALKNRKVTHTETTEKTTSS